MRLMKVYFFLAIALATACNIDSNEIIEEEEIHYIENLISGFSRNLNKKDTSGVAVIVSDSIRVMQSGKSSISGIESLKYFLIENQWQQFQILDPRIEFNGKVSFVFSKFSYVVNQEKPNNPIPYRGEILLIASRSEDGLWLIDKISYSSWQQKGTNKGGNVN